MVDESDVSTDAFMLLELALVVGRTRDLELESRCKEFLRALMARKNLAYAAVWVRRSALYRNVDDTEAELVYSLPSVRSKVKTISLHHLSFQKLIERGFHIINDSDPNFLSHVIEEKIGGGGFAFFKLGEIGMLRLYTTKPSGFSEREITQLVGVIETLTISIEGALSQRRFLQEVEERQRLEQELLQSQKLRAIGLLAGGIAHDFNNLLQPIIGFSEILINTVDPQAKEHDYLATISKSARRAKDLVSQILLFSRQGQTVKIDCELGSIAREVTKLLRSTLSKSITVTARVSSNLAPVFCDPSQIHQVILNLCVNAGQAMPEAGTLGITVGNVKLEGHKCFAGTILSGNYVRLAVSDSGVGMDSETLSQIFDPFFTTTDVGEGTGLGLATVYGVVLEHNGGITVCSEPGEGSTFEVFLPAAKDNSKSREPQASKTKVPKGSETIFFVDDEEVIVAVGKTVLESQGYNVITCTDPRQALKMFKANPSRFDLVVTDQGMPQLRGDQLAAEMRKTRGNIPIILCTGYSETMTPESSKAMGINAFLYKPIDPEEFGRVVRELLDEGQQADRSKSGRQGRVNKSPAS